MSHYREKAWWLGVGIYYARAGLLSEARKWVRQHGGRNALGLQIAEGELALARGQIAEAAALLREAFKSARERLKRRGEFFDGAEALARVLEKQGDLAGAVRVLEEATEDKALAAMMTGGWRWIQLQHQRAQLCRKLGREEEAQAIEDELRKLLAYADPEHLILRELKRSGIYVVPRSGGEPRRVTGYCSFSTTVDYPSATHDGKRMLFNRNDMAGGIYILEY